MINYAMKPIDETQTFNQPIHAHTLVQGPRDDEVLEGWDAKQLPSSREDVFQLRLNDKYTDYFWGFFVRPSVCLPSYYYCLYTSILYAGPGWSSPGPYLVLVLPVSPFPKCNAELELLQ